MKRTARNRTPVGIDIIGAEDLAHALSVIGPKAAIRVLRKAVGGVARDMAEAAKARVAVDSGALRQSIRGVVRKNTENTVEAALLAGGKGARHWHLEEWGNVTRKKPVRPYLTPTYAEFRAKFDGEFRAKLGSALEKAISAEVRRRKREAAK